MRTASELGKGAIGVAGLEFNGRGRATNHALPAPTGRPVKAQGIALVWAVKQWQALVGKLTYLRSCFVFGSFVAVGR